jgi:N-methylhydantoinase A
MRYVGQNHELTVPLATGRINAGALAQAAASFHGEHRKQFGYASPDDAVQVVSCRVVAMGTSTRFEPRPQAPGGAAAVARETRPVYFETTDGWVDCPVYWRGDLSPGAALPGPAIVEQIDATTVLYPDDAATMDAHGNILITVGLEPVEVK